jgi:hypothetical protein
MSTPAIHAIWAIESPFVPRKPKIVLIGQTLVSLYPKVDSSISDAERALAFQHNKTALASNNLDQRACILTLANWLDLMLTAKLSFTDWEWKLSRNWANFANLTILLWHNMKGSPIADTTAAGDPSVLKPVTISKPRIAAALDSKLSVSNLIWTIWTFRPQREMWQRILFFGVSTSSSSHMIPSASPTIGQPNTI